MAKTKSPSEQDNISSDDPSSRYVARHDLVSLDQIDDRFNNNYYHNLDYLLEDLHLIVMKSIRDRCQNSLAKIYLTYFL